MAGRNIAGASQRCQRRTRDRPAVASVMPVNGPVEFAPGLLVRGFVPPLRLADFRLIAFDMDSTLISIECVDEIAAMAGRKAEVAAITEAAMRGEIADYKESLRRRVALLLHRIPVEHQTAQAERREHGDVGEFGAR